MKLLHLIFSSQQLFCISVDLRDLREGAGPGEGRRGPQDHREDEREGCRLRQEEDE